MKYKSEIATLVAILFLNIVGFSQNLIPNPGFEEVLKCPDGLRQLDRAKYWQEANAGTPELFHACGFKSKIAPYEGEGMAGIILLCDYDNGVEYLQVELSDTLKQNQLYCFSYYIKIDPETPIAIDKVGAYFSKERLYYPDWTPFRKYPQVVTKEILGSESKNWKKIEGTFVARGGEGYLTFGNFYARYFLKEKLINNNLSNWSSYYYLDNFELYETAKGCNRQLKNEPKLPQKTTKWNHTVYFEVAQYFLGEEEEEKLKLFIRQLPSNFSQPIKVEGYTDSDADFEYNLKLSQDRAQAISTYLKGNGKVNTYLSWSGEDSPLNANLDENQKALNRRVEIIIDRP